MKRTLAFLVFLLAAATPWAAAAETIYHPAENNVAVAMTEVRRFADRTEVHLRTLQPIGGVCWTLSGPNSPYLLSGGVRHHFQGGDYISYCPAQTNYRNNDLMVLRFAPLPGAASEFHLVEGQGGENQLTDPASQSGVRYWNFLYVRMR